MPRLRLKTLFANADRVLNPGDEADFSKEEAEQLLKGKFAEEIKPEPKPAPAKTRQVEEEVPPKETAPDEAPKVDPKKADEKK